MSDAILLPDSGDRRALLARAAELVETVFAEQPDWPIFDSRVTSEGVRERLARYDFSESSEPLDVMENVFGVMRDCGLHVGNPGYYGLFNPTPSFMGVIADLMVAAFNCQLGAWHHSPAGVEIERLLVLYFARAFGLPDSAYGHFTTGGSEANLTAVNVALAHQYPELGKVGLRGLERQPVMLASEESHHSLDKAVQQVGLGRDALIRVSVRGLTEGMDPAALEETIRRCRADDLDPFMVIATAGTTNAGIIDPMREIGAICRRHNIHMHVDGAWGGSVILSDKLRGLLDGIELADSIIIDAHKLLSVPMGAGIFLCADRAWQESAFFLDPAYVPKSPVGGMDNYRMSMQFSRRFIGLKLFMTLAAAGREGMARTIEGQVAMGDRLAELLESEGWSVVNGAPLAIVCFENPRWLELGAEKIAERNERVARHIVAGGKSWISTTRIVGRPVLRACVTSYLTREEDLQRLVRSLQEARRVADAM
jgi:aromatic-L-amino-acid decarboxylase